MEGQQKPFIADALLPLSFHDDARPRQTASGPEWGLIRLSVSSSLGPQLEHSMGRQMAEALQWGGMQRCPAEDVSVCT